MVGSHIARGNSGKSGFDQFWITHAERAGDSKKEHYKCSFYEGKGMGCRTGLEPATTRITIWGSTIELPTPFSVVVRQTLPVLFHFGKKKMSLMSFLNGIFSQLYNKNMIGRLFVSHLENYGETVWSSIAPSWI